MVEEHKKLYRKTFEHDSALLFPELGKQEENQGKVFKVFLASNWLRISNFYVCDLLKR